MAVTFVMIFYKMEILKIIIYTSAASSKNKNEGVIRSMADSPMSNIFVRSIYREVCARCIQKA